MKEVDSGKSSTYYVKGSEEIASETPLTLKKLEKVSNKTSFCRKLWTFPLQMVALCATHVKISLL
jgi:hypothetical protein